MRTAPSLVLVALALVPLAAGCRIEPVPMETATRPARPNRVVMGYYPSWARAELPPAEIAFRNLTHVVHAFAWPDSDGTLVVPEGFLDPALNAAARAAGVRMMLGLGGGGRSAGFPALSASAAGRVRLVAQVVGFCEANGYDGVDLDWEFASNEAERAGFSALVEALAAALKSRSPAILLTMAAPARNFHGRWIDFERLADDFDFIGFMTYDYHGAWSAHSGHNAPLRSYGADACGSVDETFQYALGRGVPASKVLLGLPFFGRSFDCGGPGLPFASSQSWDHKDVAGLPAAEWTRVWDREAQVPWMRRADGRMMISYDDPGSISLKCQYVKDQGAAGVILWALGQDHRAGRSELLDVVGRSFGVR